jgi:hypothetical protein
VGRLVPGPKTPCRKTSSPGPGRLTTAGARSAASGPEQELLGQAGKMHIIYTRLDGGVFSLTEASWKQVPHSGVARWSRRTRPPSWHRTAQGGKPQ